MGPAPNHPILTAIVLTLMVLPAPAAQQHAPLTFHRSPDYGEMIATAQNIAKTINDHTMPHAELRQTYPFLFSSTLILHELMKGMEKILKSDNFLEQLLQRNISANCVNNTVEFLLALGKKTTWAMTIIDTLGKPPPDVMDGNLVWPGAVKECLNLNKRNLLMSPAGNFTPAPFQPQYCCAVFNFMPGTAENPLGMALRTGLCVPDSCSELDLEIILNAVLYELNIKLPLPTSVQCLEVDPPWDKLAIAALVVAGFFVILMIVGTLVDIAHSQLFKWRLEKIPDFSSNSPSDSMTYHDDIVLLGGLAPKEPEPKFGYRLLIAFSVYTNGAKLLSVEQSAGTLGCVHGIRFLSMTWVILGHTYLNTIGVSANMLVFFKDAVNQWTFQAIANATVSVDTFFVLSGLLVSYLSLKELRRSGGKINWFKFYFHRFWRLTPPYMLIILLYAGLGRYMGSGPQWLPEAGDRENCKTTWWTNLLYINNFVQSDKMCLGQSWYLANDMQFFILSPLIFVPLFWHRVFGIVVVLVFLCTVTIVPAALTMRDHFSPGFLVQVNTTNEGQRDWQLDYYYKPYNRMGPYIIGLLTGYLLYRTDCKMRINRAANLLCWAIAAALALAVLYGLYPYRVGQEPAVTISLSLSAFYNAVARTVWGAAVAWVIFACVTGNGGFINTILSWKAIVPLSRLTYVVYLLHLWMLSSYMLSRDTVFYLNDVNVVVLFLAVLVASYGISVVVSLAFEAPMLALEKLFLKKDN